MLSNALNSSLDLPIRLHLLPLQEPLQLRRTHLLHRNNKNVSIFALDPRILQGEFHLQ